MDETTKKYTLRDLEAHDAFAMSKIINGIGVSEFATVFNKDNIRKIASNQAQEIESDDEMAEAIGIDVFIEIAGIVLKNVGKCEQDLYAFMASLAGIKPRDIEHMPMNEFFDMIVEIVQKHEFKDFMQVASKLFK